MAGTGLCKPPGGFASRTSVQLQVLRPRVACSAGRGGGGKGGRGGGAGRGRGGGGGGGGGSRSQRPERVVEEDVEIFSLDSGWNVEALADVQGLLGALDDMSDSEDEEGEDWGPDEGMDDTGGWSVVAGTGRRGGDAAAVLGGSDYEDEFLSDEEDEEEEEQGAAAAAEADPAARSAGPSPRKRGGASKDLGQAERDLLSSLPTHLLRRLEGEQAEADAEAARLTPTAQRKASARQRTHRRLRIVSGYAAGRRLLSPQGDETRPMMEMVRGAVFNMIMSLYGCPGGMPEGSRWLDLFAGTGAIGLEALSRGCAEAHFVELSPWVTNNCLLPNVEACEAEDTAIVHNGKAEDFMRRAQTQARFAGGAFEFVSVCPPYELVDYDELYTLLEGSPLVGPDSLVIVEYPRRLGHLVRDNIGPLVKLRDRRYGRTFIAMYGPEGAEEEGGGA